MMRHARLGGKETPDCVEMFLIKNNLRKKLLEIGVGLCYLNIRCDMIALK